MYIGCVGGQLLELLRVFIEIIPSKRENLFAIDDASFRRLAEFRERLVTSAMSEVEVAELPMRVSIGRSQFYRPSKRSLCIFRALGLFVCTTEFEPPSKIIRREAHDLFEKTHRFFGTLR